jgi:diguanylate cyclase (GGDEF)-like protein
MSFEHRADLRQQVQRLTTLQAVSTRIVSALDPDAVLDELLDSLRELLVYQAAAVYLVAGSEMPPRLRARRDFDASRHRQLLEDEVAPEHGSVVQAIHERRVLSSVEASGGSTCVVPLAARGRILGALEVTSASPLPVADVQLLELLAPMVAVALHNAHLLREAQRLATTDPLTGLSNYRHFHELLELEVQRARRMRYAVGLLVIDLDHFKLVNDRHGHPAGDRTLQCVADLLRTSLRRTDVVARVGGEEFAVILPGDALDEVAVVAEKLRRAVEALPPVTGGGAQNATGVTLSIGGASQMPETLDKQALINSADQALYQAKRHGRNQVRLESPRVPRE